MKLNWVNLWTVGSLVVLVGSEVIATSAATAWAASGLFHLTPLISDGLMLVAVAGGLALTVVFARQAFRVEPFIERPRRDDALPPGQADRGAAHPGAVP